MEMSRRAFLGGPGALLGSLGLDLRHHTNGDQPLTKPKQVNRRLMSPTAPMAPPLIGLEEPLRWYRFRVSDVEA